MFIAFILIILGIVFLLKNLGLISGSAWGIIWPLLLIVFGLSLLFKKRGCFSRSWDFWHQKEKEEDKYSRNY